MSLKRAKAALLRQREHHQARLDQAGTPRERLRAACMWLIAEAKRGGPQVLDQETDVVMERVDQLRKAAGDPEGGQAS